ncbi:MAG: hypothetical protein M3O30_18205 [Planctomycetota bacterium]|nr:hypothetical protein [Planctomycetota bacterium]
METLIIYLVRTIVSLFRNINNRNESKRQSSSQGLPGANSGDERSQPDNNPRNGRSPSNRYVPPMRKLAAPQHGKARNKPRPAASVAPNSHQLAEIISRMPGAVRESPAGRALIARMNVARQAEQAAQRAFTAKQAPAPTPAAVVQTPAAIGAARATATATAQPSPISAIGIRQLMSSRASAMRTIYVLSEVVGLPVALRE